MNTEKNKNHNKGFTLLELLIVVLIIGILASIALPKYKFAVEKSKFSALKNITRAVAEAEERYFLTHNRYTIDMDSLDINIDYYNTSCTSGKTQCSYRLDEKQTKSISLNFGAGQTIGMLRGKGYQVAFVYNHVPKQWRCIPYARDIGYRICQNDGTIEKNGGFYY